MAWSLTTDVHPASAMQEALNHTTPRAHISKDQLDQVHAAKDAAIRLIDSGQIGDPKVDHYRVSISGHHGNSEAEDSINVAITAVSVAPPDEA